VGRHRQKVVAREEAYKEARRRSGEERKEGRRKHEEMLGKFVKEGDCVDNNCGRSGIGICGICVCSSGHAC